MNVRAILLAVAAAACAVTSSAAPKFTVFRTPDKTLGVYPPPVSLNEWQGGNLAAERVPPASAFRVMDELDFFRQEYGRHLAPFSFTVGEGGWRRKWGTEGRERDKPAIRFGRGWDAYPKYNYCLDMELEQNVPETEWTLVRYRRFGYSDKEKKDFRIKGRGKVSFRLPLGPVKSDAAHWVNGILLECRTKGARVKVSRLVFAPFPCELSWRRRFTLGEKPFRGGISFTGLADYVLYVNGEPADTGRRIAAPRIRRKDITRHLRKGENEIVITGNFNSGYGPMYRFLVNAFAVDPAGKTTVIPSDGRWEWRYAGGEWRKPQVFGTAGIAAQPNGNLFACGGYPLHPGPLDPRPAGKSRYPVFDEGEKIGWEVRLPPRIAEPALSVEVRDALAGRIFLDGFKGLKAGAYRVTWRLSSGGKEIDRVTREMAVVGKLDLPEVPVEKVEEETKKRQRLVSEIDCTLPVSDPAAFIDHSNWYGTRIGMNVGRVTERPSGRYRETGSGRGDLFSYRIGIGRPGRPHVLEFDYPDDAERMIYCAVMDSIALPFRNNTPPEGFKSWPGGTCGVRCGGLMPLSGKKLTCRVLFFPASKVNTVYFENGLEGTRAAVSAVRVYEIEGDLPVPPPADTARLYGNHNERPLMHHWGAFVTPLIHEYDGEDMLLKWTAAWWSVANRIRQLRHFGHNCSIEGGYMYHTGYPSASGVTSDISEDFDYNELILRMYKANGIRVFLGYEYTCSPDVALSGVRSVGDRENREGTARPADQVDRYGRQITGHGPAVNAFCPTVWEGALRAAREMYLRYAPLGAVEGVVAQTGRLWLPSFGSVNGDVSPDEVGYDDCTVEAFERDTGISLGLPRTGGGRFAARYALLTGRYRKEWSGWRRRVMARKAAELAAQCRGAYGNWTFTVSPCREGGPTKEDLAAEGVGYLPKIPYGKELQLDEYVAGFGRKARAARAGCGQMYLAPSGLNERLFTQLNCATGWWWQTSRCVVFETKPAGRNAMYDVSLVLADGFPRTLFHTWLDMNVPTGCPDEERGAAYRFYSVPEGDAVPVPGVTGITARRIGRSVTFVNATPYRVKGRLSSGASGEILFAPFEVRTIDAGASAAGLKGKFTLCSQGASVVAGQKKYLGMPQVRKNLGAEFVESLEASPAEYDAAVLLRDPEMFSAVRDAFGDDGLSAYVNGREPERYVREGKILIDWSAGAANGNLKVSVPEGAVRTEDGVTFMRLENREKRKNFWMSLRENPKLPNGVRTFEARMRVHGSNGFVQVFAPWKSRFDLYLESGRCRTGVIAWPGDDRFHSAKLDGRHSMPAGEWFDVASRIDPEGDIALYVNGYLMKRIDPVRLHGDFIPDASATLHGGVSSRSDEQAALDIAYMRLVRNDIRNKGKDRTE